MPELPSWIDTLLDSFIPFASSANGLYHKADRSNGLISTDKIFFDEMESYIHSKVYPVSIGLAVDVRYKKIIDIQVASIKLKGQLQVKIAKQGIVPLKIQNRPNNSPQMRIEVIKNVRKALRPDGVIYSDEKPAYITLLDSFPYFLNGKSPKLFKNLPCICRRLQILTSSDNR